MLDLSDGLAVDLPRIADASGVGIDLEEVPAAEGDTLEIASDAERINMVRYDAVLFDPGTIWSIEANQAVIFIVDIFYYNEDEDYEDE